MTAVPTGTPAQNRQLVADGEVAYLRAGDGPLVLVLHHEIGNPGWLPFHERLASRSTVIVPDLPGYGSSTRPGWARHPRDLAILVHLLLDGMGVHQLEVVGLGFGGWVAAEMATMQQSRFRHMVLVNPYGLQPREGEILDQFLMSHEDFVRAGFGDPAAFDSLFGALPSVEQLELWDIHREMTTRIAWKPYMFNPTLGPLLSSVRVPTLVLAGSKDCIVPADCARRYLECLPNSQLKVLDGAGHFLEVERPSELAAIVSQFLQEEPRCT